MTTSIPWGDGSGDNIYLTYPAASGDQIVAVASDANKGSASRSKSISFSASGLSPVTLTIEQAAAYKRVSYLSCAGDSAIDTGIVVADTDAITIDYELNSLSKTGDKYLLSCSAGYTGGGIWLETYGNANRWYTRFGSSSSVNGTFASYVSGRHIAELKKNSCAIDGTKILSPSYSSMPSTPLNFGGRILADRSVTGFYGYIYDCAILNSGGDYRFHGVPAVRLADDVAGVLDLVSGQFFESVDAAFVAGPDV